MTFISDIPFDLSLHILTFELQFPCQIFVRRIPLNAIDMFCYLIAQQKPNLKYWKCDPILLSNVITYC